MPDSPPPLHPPPPLPAKRTSLPWPLLGGSIAVFLLSLALPALRLENGDVWNGATVLAMGWLGVFIGHFGWLANLFWLVSIVLLALRKPWITLALALAALAIGAASWGILHAEIPLDEAGVKKTTVLAFGAAFYVWLAALAAPGIAALLLRSSKP